MGRYTVCLSLIIGLSLVTPAWAYALWEGNCERNGGLGILRTEVFDNGDGTQSWWFSINPNIGGPEVAFLQLTIYGVYDDLHQVSGGPTYDAISASPWAPSVVFTSDALLAGALNPAYAENAAQDTVIDDTYWPGKVNVELTPAAGTGGDVAGTQMVHVALTSFTGGIGGPIPGDVFFPLAHVTTGPNGYVRVFGTLQTDTDLNGAFSSPYSPEPSSALLAIMGALAVISSTRRRRK